MNLPTVLVLLSTLPLMVFSSDYYNNTWINSSPGLYYENIGNLNLYNDKWKLVIYLDLFNYHNEYKMILYYRNILETFCKLAESRGLENNECDSLKQTTEYFLKDINTNDKIILEMLGADVQSRSRIRRGLLNIIGSISKTLFGTLDEEDAKFFDSQIQKLKNNQNHLTKLLKEQTSIVQSTLLDRNSWFLNRTKLLENKLQITENFVNNLVVKQNSTNYNLEINMKITEIFSLFSFIETIFKSHQEKLLSIIQKSLEGKLDPLIISPVELIKHLSNLQNYMDGLSLPVSPILENTHVLFKLTETNVYFYNNKVTFVLYVPLIIPREYGIYKISSLPTQVSLNRYAIIVPESNNLCIDAVKQHYIMLSDLELAFCKTTVGNNYVCKQKKPILLVHLHGGCEANLFVPSLSIPKTCNKKILFVAYPIFIQLAQANSWLYTIPTKENVDLNCKSIKQRLSLTLNGTGIFHINSNCSAYTKDMILAPHNEYFTKTTINYIPPLDIREEIHFNFSKLNNIEMLKINSPTTIQSNDIQTLSKFSQDLNSLTLDLEEVQDQSYFSWNLHNIIVYVILLILLSVLISYYIIKKMFIIVKPQVKNEIKIPETCQTADETEVVNEKVQSESHERAENCNPRYNFQN